MLGAKSKFCDGGAELMHWDRGLVHWLLAPKPIPHNGAWTVHRHFLQMHAGEIFPYILIPLEFRSFNLYLFLKSD